MANSNCRQAILAPYRNQWIAFRQIKKRALFSVVLLANKNEKGRSCHCICGLCKLCANFPNVIVSISNINARIYTFSIANSGHSRRACEEGRQLETFKALQSVSQQCVPTLMMIDSKWHRPNGTYKHRQREKLWYIDTGRHVQHERRWCRINNASWGSGPTEQLTRLRGRMPAWRQNFQ